MDRLQRITWALLLVAAGCGDDVTGGGESSTTDGSSTGTDTVDPTSNPTTTIDPTMGSSSSGGTDGSTTDDTDGTGSSTTDDTDGSTTDDTDGSTTDDTDGSTTDDTDGTTGMPELCGNDMLDDSEVCDGADLGDATCESEGFVSGDLSCTARCTLDTSACETCGDGVIDAGDVCDGDDLGGADCTTLAMGFTGGTLGCSAGCEYDTAACTSFAQPTEGQVVITEVMPNPAVLSDGDSEWFELHNPSDTDGYQLMGCQITGGATEDPIEINTDLVIPAGGYITFARGDSPGFTPDFVWTETHSLSNSGDTLALDCGGVVDQVTWGNNDLAGQSFNLDIDATDAVSNDNLDNWCYGTDVYFTDPVDADITDAGTPGAMNIDCPEPVVYTIDNCRVQFPETINEEAGTSVTVYGRVQSTGLTDMTAGNDLADEFSGQLGYGPDGTDPMTDATWTWIDATPNAGWAGAEAGYDEYEVSLTVPAAGEYDYAYRFSGDDEGTYTYCDTGAGSSDGYDAANAGQMTANASSVVYNLYFSEYLEEGNNKALEIFNSGAEAVDLSACEIRQYFNGNDTSTNQVALSGTLAAGGTAVVCRDNATMEILDACDVVSGSLGYNGNDALELVCASSTLDVFGQIGDSPMGGAWVGTMGSSTLDVTLRRNCDAGADPDGSDAFDPDLQWTAFPENTFDDLGMYVCE